VSLATVQVFASYADLLGVVADLPKPGLSAADVNARRLAEARRLARRMPLALQILWTIWAALAAVNVAVWFLVVTTVEDDVYPWPIWLLAPGVALAATTIGVQAIRRQRRCTKTKEAPALRPPTVV